MTTYTVLTTLRDSTEVITTKCRTESGVFTAQAKLVPYDTHQRMGDFFIAFDPRGLAFSVCEYSTPEITPVWTCEGMRNDRLYYQIPALRKMLEHDVARRHPYYKAIKAAIAREEREWAARRA